MHNIRDFTDFTEIVANFSGSCLFIKATAKWCAPCKAIQPYYSQIAAKAEKDYPVKFFTFDVDEIPQLADKLNVVTLPTFYCLQDQEVAHLVGTDPKRLSHWVQQCVGKKVN